MAPTMYVKPAREGLIVRQPERNYQPLPSEGARVEVAAYWMAQIRDGAVVEIDPPDGK